MDITKFDRKVIIAVIYELMCVQLVEIARQFVIGVYNRKGCSYHDT